VTPLRTVTVTVTGAAGAIGYALLPVSPAGNMLGEDTLVSCGYSRSRRACRHWRRGHGAGGQRVPLVAGVEITDDPTSRSPAPTSRCWWAPAPRTKGMSAPSCWRPTAHLTVQGKR